MKVDGGELAEFLRWRPLYLDLLSEVHPGHLAARGLSPGAIRRLRECERSRWELSREAGWLLPPGASDDWRPWRGREGETAAWALLPGGELWKAGLRLGAARFRLEISRLAWRKDVRAFKTAAGEDAYRFALRQAAMVWRGAVLTDESDLDRLPLGERTVRTAGLGLGCWLSGLPTGLAARARLKLPPEAGADLDLASSWDGDRRSNWLSVLKRIVALAARVQA